MIDGYAHKTSVAPGGTLILHVATDAARFRVRFYRFAHDARPMHVSPWLAGAYAAPCGPDEDWDWPPYAFGIPRDWPSAVYVAQFDVPGRLGNSLDGTQPGVVFVVRGRGVQPLLYKLPTATYHAYNAAGGGCFYTNPPRSRTPPGGKVSLRRPGGGMGGAPWGACDHYDPRSPRQTFAHWDAPFIRWLAGTGYTPEFCTDFDLHEDPALCHSYRLLVSVGHDEYWSEAMREAVEAFIRRGGNVAFFGANVCWWRIHVVDEGGAIVCHQGGPQGARDHWWSACGAGRPEDRLTGVSYRHGGGWWDGPRTRCGYIVQQPDHWAFAGTHLRRGDRFGQDTDPPLVGYECDGVPLLSLAGLRATVSPHARACGTPDTFQILAVSPLDGAWQERPARERACGDGPHNAAMGVYTNGGTVFTCGTTDWAQVLANAHPPVPRITRNVIDHLLGHE